MQYYGMLDFTSVFEEPTTSIFRAQGPTWRKQVLSKFTVVCTITTQLCISEHGKVKSNGVLSTGAGRYGTADTAYPSTWTQVSWAHKTRIYPGRRDWRGGGVVISLVVQQTDTLILLYTELTNDGEYILHFIKDCARQAIPITCRFLRS